MILILSLFRLWSLVPCCLLLVWPRLTHEDSADKAEMEIMDIIIALLITIGTRSSSTKKTKKVHQKKFWRHKNERLGEEEWERKLLKNRWIIPHFSDVTFWFLIDFLSMKLFIVPIKMTLYWPTIGQLKCILAHHRPIKMYNGLWLVY